MNKIEKANNTAQSVPALRHRTLTRTRQAARIRAMDRTCQREFNEQLRGL
jgi:hypothetical protein